MPTGDNWYANGVNIIRSGNRYLRYLAGEQAELFIDIAKSLEEYNIIRHRFVAHLLTYGRTTVLSQEDHHHYFMPTRQSVAIGCFVTKASKIVPIFSRPGREISLFEVQEGGQNQLRMLSTDDDILIVPHGWGKTCQQGIGFTIDSDRQIFDLSGREYRIEPLVSLGKDERLELRDFSTTPDDENSFFTLMKHHCPGRVVGQIKQLASYTKHGFLRHHYYKSEL